MPNMTGRPGYRTMEMNGGSSAPYLARTLCVPLFCTLFHRGGNRRAFRLPGAGGDHFHCTVEPSSGHIRCRGEERNSRNQPVHSRNLIASIAFYTAARPDASARVVAKNESPT